MRFEDISDFNAILRLDAGVDTTDFAEFLAVAEDLNLRIVEIAQNAGAVFSGPGQYVHFSEFKAGSPEQLAQIEATLEQWRQQDRLPFPNYGADDIASFKDNSANASSHHARNCSPCWMPQANAR